MNPKVVTAIYGSAFVGPVVLSIAYALWQNKHHKDSPTTPRFNDTENGERRINPKFIKIIHSGLERS